MNIETKKCSGKCDQEKTLDLFPKGKNKCKVCVAEHKKEYCEKNKEKIAIKQKIYYDKHKEEILENKKEYHKENKDKIAVKDKIYYDEHKEEIIERVKGWQKENSEKAKETKKEYYQENKEEILKCMKEYREENKERRNGLEKEKRDSDPIHRFMHNLRSNFKHWIRSNSISKNGRLTFNCLPYTFDEYITHITSQFEWWMTLENQGVYSPKTWDDNDPTTWKWQLDHIIPQSTFIPTSIDDTETIQKCWALSNLRPLSAKQNQLDGATRIRH